MYVCVCVWVCAYECRYLWSPEEGIRAPGAGVTGTGNSSKSYRLIHCNITKVKRILLCGNLFSLVTFIVLLELYSSY